MATAFQVQAGEREQEKAMGPSVKGTADRTTSLASFATNPEYIRQLTLIQAEKARNLNNTILVVSPDTNLAEAWRSLTQNNFYSAPIINIKTQKYLGYLDLMDIVEYVVLKFGRNRLEGQKNFWDLIHQDEQFQKATVRSVMSHPLSMITKASFQAIYLDFSMFSAIEMLAKMPNVHRVAVIDANRRLYGIITQSRLARVIHKHNLEGRTGTALNMPIWAVEGAIKPIVTAKETEDAIMAFRKMVAAKVTAVAVENADGQITGVLSAKDLKLMSEDGKFFWKLFQIVSSFQYEISRLDPNRPKELIVLSTSDTLAMAVEKMAKANVHRVFIVDEHRRPIGVIGMREVMRQIISSGPSQLALAD